MVEGENVMSIFLRKMWATWLAIRRRMAVGMPSGQSFDLLRGS
jgi:hypothetical protein